MLSALLNAGRKEEEKPLAPAPASSSSSVVAPRESQVQPPATPATRTASELKYLNEVVRLQGMEKEDELDEEVEKQRAVKRALDEAIERNQSMGKKRREAQEERKHKTFSKICMFWRQNDLDGSGCYRGMECPYAHGEEEWNNSLERQGH